MPYPEWLGNATLGTMAGVGGGFPPNAPTIADIGNTPPQGPQDPFDIRFGQWQATRSPSGALPATMPAPNAPPPQLMPPRQEELLQAPPPGATMLAQPQPRPFWQRFLGALGDNPPRRLAPTALPAVTLGAGPRFGALGGAGRVRNIYGSLSGTGHGV